MARTRKISIGIAIGLSVLTAGQAAGESRRAARFADVGQMEESDAETCAEWSKKVSRLEKALAGRDKPKPDMADVAYGAAPRQKFDVYFAKPNEKSAAAPVIVMVHGGGWCVGNKNARGVVANKMTRWTPKGFVFISVNYPMVDDGSDAIAQAHDIARATAYIQKHASEWGGDPERVILMGHSAGAHLVSLVNADAALRKAEGVGKILGTVSLDAGAIDVVKQMPNVYPFLKVRYREAFGETEEGWIAASPYHQLDRTAGPWLGVCASQRKDKPCDQAQAYADKSNGLGVKAAVLPQPKNHGAINKELGEPREYTAAVEQFMASLDPVVAGLLR